MQWQIQGRGGAGGPAPPLLLDQTEARRAEKIVLETGTPLPPPLLPFPLSLGLDDRAPPLSEGLDSPLPMVPLSHT